MQKAAGGLRVASSVLSQDTPEGGGRKRETIFRWEQAIRNPLTNIFIEKLRRRGRKTTTRNVLPPRMPATLISFPTFPPSAPKCLIC